jgi:TolB protein
LPLEEQTNGFPIASGSELLDAVSLAEADEHYGVNWHTDQFTISDGITYRIRVFVAGSLLGYADVDVVNSGKELKNVETGEYIALKDGRTLPIKFRIEVGAVYVVGSGGGTVSAMDGTVTLEFPEGALTQDTGITVNPAVGYPTDPDLVPGSVYDFGPDGTQFVVPLELTIQYDPDSIPTDGDESDLVLVHLTDDVWTEVAGSSADVATHSVTGPVSSFSVYGVAFQSSVPVPVLSAPLVFQSNRDGDYEIFTLDNTGLTQITSNEVSDGAPDWRGDRIVYQSLQNGNYDIWRMDDAGGSAVNLTNTTDADEYGGWLSPDGTRIAFVRWPHGPVPEEFDIWVMNTDGTGQVNLTPNSSGHDGGVSWSPDGSRIAFQSKREGNGNMEVYVMNSDGSGVTRLTYDEAYSDAGPEWSPDGSQIVFAKYKAGVEGEIWIMNADGSTQHSITTSDGTMDMSPAWSPDGSQIAFTRYPNLPSGPSDIWLTTPDGSTPVAIVTDAAYDLSPSWKKEVVPPIQATKVWVGGAVSDPTEWSNQDNWAPVGVPTASDDVFIPAGAVDQPRLTEAVEIHDLYVDDGATLDLAGFELTVSGNLRAGSAGVSGGVMVMTGNPGTLSGHVVARTSILGSISLSADVVMGEMELFVRDAGMLDLNGHALMMPVDASTFMTFESGVLVMQTAGSYLDVHGASFEGGSTVGLLTEGTMRVRGGLGVSGGGGVFAPSGNHTVLFEGSTDPNGIEVSGAGFGDGSSYLNHAVVGDGQTLDLNIVSLGSGSIQVTGLFSMHNATLTSTGDTLVMHSMNVTNSVIENTQLFVDCDGTSTITLNNAVFMNFAADAVQLAISHPGGVFSFDNNSFWGLQAGDAGYYLVAEDTDLSGGIPLQLLVGSDPGNGGDFTSTTGAVVTWVP